MSASISPQPDKLPPSVACHRSPHIAVTDLPGKGRAVIATQSISAHAVLEVAPVIPLTMADSQAILPTHIENYVFQWQENDENGLPQHAVAVALGLVSLCNHSPDANADFVCDHAQRVVRLTSNRTIHAGEEITIDYAIPLWFEAVE